MLEGSRQAVVSGAVESATTERGRVGRFEATLRPLRVALVHDWLNGMRGGEKVLEQFCILFPDAEIFTLIHEPSRLSPLLRSMRTHRPSAWWAKPLAKHYRKALPLLPRAIRTLPTEDFDLVIASSHCVAKAAPPPRDGVMAAYIHAPMRYVWDRFRDYLGGGHLQDLALRLARGPMQRWDAGSNGGIDTLAANSRYVAEQLRRWWGREARVIMPPVDLDRFRPSGVPPGDYFLVVSALVPYKRVDRAIRAAKLARVPLVVVGDGPERTRLEAMAGDNARFVGWAPDAELPALYSNARALLYPGVEDFGITALEAQACGRPVIALRAGGALETVKAPVTGAFFDEPSARALAELLASHRDGEYDSAAIRAHAEGFSPLAFRASVLEWLREDCLAQWPNAALPPLR